MYFLWTFCTGIPFNSFYNNFSGSKNTFTLLLIKRRQVFMEKMHILINERVGEENFSKKMLVYVNVNLRVVL